MRSDLTNVPAGTDIGDGAGARRAGAPGGGTAAGPPAPEPGGRETVLLVEDDRAVRVLVALALRGAGYTVLEAGTGAGAGAALAGARGAVRLLLTDVVLPDETGRDLALRLFAAAPGLRVLFTSGYTDDAVVRRGIISSEVEFLQKPFDIDALLRAVREVLDKPDTAVRWPERPAGE